MRTISMIATGSVGLVAAVALSAGHLTESGPLLEGGGLHAPSPAVDRDAAGVASPPAVLATRLRAQFFAPPPELTDLAVEAFGKGVSTNILGPSAPRSASVAPVAQTPYCTNREPDRFYEFYFMRAIYSEGRRGRGRDRGWGGRNGGSWDTDYPKADCQFISVVKRLAGLDIYGDSWAVPLDDPIMRSYPFLYMLEVGDIYLTDEERQGLRDYLAAGGFLVVDDFWGTDEWRGFEEEMRRTFPGREIVELPMDHTLFRIFYNIDEVLQVPNVGNGRAFTAGYGSTHERDGRIPYVLGIHDDEGRLMVVINWNTDLGDAWEWAEDPYYPLDRSTFAFEMGVNMILYSMTH